DRRRAERVPDFLPARPRAGAAAHHHFFHDDRGAGNLLSRILVPAAVPLRGGQHRHPVGGNRWRGLVGAHRRIHRRRCAPGSSRSEAVPAARTGYLGVRKALLEFLGLKRNILLLLAAIMVIQAGEELWTRFLPKYLQSLGAA